MDNRFVIYGLNAQVWDVAALLTALCHAAPESNAATPKHLTLALPQLLQSTSSLLVRHKKAGAGTANAAHRKKKKKMGRRVLPSVDEVPMRTIAPTGGVTPLFVFSLASLAYSRQPTPLGTWIETQEHRRLGEGEMWSNPG